MGNNSSKGSGDMESLQRKIKSADIVVFQSSTCPYCAQALTALRQAGHSPTVVDASTEERNLLRELTTSSSVPNIWVKGKFVGGCNDGPESWMGIRKLINNGKLTEMLSDSKL